MEQGTGSPVASLGRADRGSAPEPPKTAPAGACGLLAAKGKGSLRRAKSFRCRNAVPHALRARSFRCGTAPSLVVLRCASASCEGASRAVEPRFRAASTASVLRFTQEGTNGEMNSPPFLKRFWSGAGPSGGRAWGEMSRAERVSRLCIGVRGGAQSARPSESEGGGSF